MKYKSTRGGVSGISFKKAVMMGLATDGGLIVPEQIPDISVVLNDWAGSSYNELAFNVMSLYIDDIEADDLKDIIQRSYETFDDEKVTPLHQLDQLSVLELYHGPTLAFKDVALQFLGNVFELILKQENTQLNILGATSGDTGSAAIAGIRGKDNIDIFIMFPEGKTSQLQELQMTSVLDPNVHNIAVEGSFDDCQTLMKAVFSDLEYKQQHNLAAVNSVNWARVLAQVVYYFSAYFQLGSPAQFDVSVPTGNFGNIFAGYIARQMGLPIRRLILATNENDILARFFNSGVYERRRVNFTHSPAMDIQIASNFERYLYYQVDQNPQKVSEFMQTFLDTGRAEMRFNADRFDADIVSAAVTNATTIETIQRYYHEQNYLVDPHTAVGLTIAEQQLEEGVPMLCLSTAHPAKFDTVMAMALPDVEVTHPDLEALRGLPTRKRVMAADIDAIKALIADS